MARYWVNEAEPDAPAQGPGATVVGLVVRAVRRVLERASDSLSTGGGYGGPVTGGRD